MANRGTLPRTVRGFRDVSPNLNELRWRIINAASAVYRSYGFEHWDTPVVEYAECLGKYLPDSDTIDQGVYSFRNPEREPILDTDGREMRDNDNNVLMENHFLSLRYDLTAPLARKYASDLWDDRHSAKDRKVGMPLFRRFQYGPVYRFEAKLDPGRFREFWQLDFDTVGVADVTCDAEVCCILSDALEAIGLARGTYEVRVNNRKLHAGLFQKLGLEEQGIGGDIMRVLDKYDKIGRDGIAGELGPGRTDSSGARIPGLALPDSAIASLLDYVELSSVEGDRSTMLARLEPLLGQTPAGREGLDELTLIHQTLAGLGYGDDRVRFDPSIARGLAYYTGPVFEAVSTLEVRDEAGLLRRFGAISGGGRYDNLVEKLLHVPVPATGASIGVDRLAELLSLQGEGKGMRGPVLITVMDRPRMAEYQALAHQLRAAGIETEVYYGGEKRLKGQFAYADARGCPVAIIAGGNEFEKGTVSIKDLYLGKEYAKNAENRETWLAANPAQVEVPVTDMVETVKGMLARS